MMFSELASIRVDGAKQAALLLHSLPPSDRAWVLSKLDAEQLTELQPLIAELDDMGLPSRLTPMDREALEQSLDLAGGSLAGHLLARAGSPAGVDRTALSDADFLKGLTPQEQSALARAWSVEQPELVAYALKLQQWPWQSTLLEQLPVTQRGRVQNALELMMPVTAESRLALALMVQMRALCAGSKREAVATASAPAASRSGKSASPSAQPLDFLLQGWKRWTAGLRREAP